jgi:hypothetical protein
MHDPFEYLDALIRELDSNNSFSNEEELRYRYLTTDLGLYHYKSGSYPVEDYNVRSIEKNCIREIDEYFDQNEANNNSYAALLLRMHKIDSLFDQHNIVKKRDALLKLKDENDSEFSMDAHFVLLWIEAGENVQKHINIRFNLLNINIYDLKNAIDEAFIDIDIKEPREIVLLLERLGIFDFLRKELSGISNNQLGVIFGKVSKTKPGSISKAIGRLSDKTANTKAEEKIDELVKKLKLPIKGK